MSGPLTPEVLLPGLNLWLVGYWLPKPDSALGTFILALTILHIGIGYVLAASVIAALRHLVFEDR